MSHEAVEPTAAADPAALEGVSKTEKDLLYSDDCIFDGAIKWVRLQMNWSPAKKIVLLLLIWAVAILSTVSYLQFTAQ